MKSLIASLAFLVALVAPPSAVIAGALVDSGEASFPSGSSGKSGVDFERGGENVFARLSAVQQDDVQACRLKQDVTAAIESSIKKAAASSRRVVLPAGCYRTTRTIALPSDMALVGASMQATRIIPSGNFPAIAALGTYAHGLNGVMIENLSVVCAGMAKSEAMGVRLAYVNRVFCKTSISMAAAMRSTCMISGRPESRM
jgi:cold shock CspA family protein